MEEVTLDMALQARERRSQRQRELLRAYAGKALVCLTVNAPGPAKRTAAADRVFAAGLSALSGALSDSWPVLYRELMEAPTGREAYLAVDAEPLELKRLCCQLEDTLAYGRLLDIDVLGRDGAPISRRQLGLPARGCMVCGKEGPSCASRRLHPLSELTAVFATIAENAPEELE